MDLGQFYMKYFLEMVDEIYPKLDEKTNTLKEYTLKLYTLKVYTLKGYTLKKYTLTPCSHPLCSFPWTKDQYSFRQ